MTKKEMIENIKEIFGKSSSWYYQIINISNIDEHIAETIYLQMLESKYASLKKQKQEIEKELEKVWKLLN